MGNSVSLGSAAQAEGGFAPTSRAKEWEATETEVLPYDIPDISLRCFPRAGRLDDIGAKGPVQDIPGARVINVETCGCMLECVLVEYEAALSANEKQRVFVHFHGNGELAWQSARKWADRFHDTLDVRACLFVEYRGYGDSTGSPCLCGMQEDLSAVFAALEVEVGAMECIVYGRSIGSIFALSFAAKYAASTAGLILESGISEIQQWVIHYTTRGKSDDPTYFFKAVNIDPAAAAACADVHLNTRARLQQYVGPLLVLHTAGDRIVPVEHAESFRRFAAEATGRPWSSLVIWQVGGHNDIHQKNSLEYLQELRNFSFRIAK